MFVHEERSTGDHRRIPIAGAGVNLGYARFLQPDPIGYDDGLNWYNYVGGDPINFVDLRGTARFCYERNNHDGDYGTDSDGNTFVLANTYTTQCVEYDAGDASPSDGDRGGGGGGGGGSNAATILKKIIPPRIDCTGKAYVLAGNPANVGKEGFPGVTVTNGSAAVIPQQFTGALTGGPLMRAIGASAYGTVTATDGRTQSFNRITQSIGFARLGSASQVQSMLMARDPGALVVEIVGGQDFGKDATINLSLPNLGEQCPAGTK